MSRAQPYTQEQRNAIVHEVYHNRRKGENISGACRRIGMRDCTVTKWKSAIDRGLGNLSTKVKKSMQVPSKMSYALKLYNQGISLATAAHQADVSEDDLVAELKKRRIK